MEHEQPKLDSIDREILLEVGAEGGSLYIARFKHTDQTWRYVCVINETVMADFEEFASDELYKESGVVTTFEEALKMMDKYPWPKLYPLLEPIRITLVNLEYDRRNRNDGKEANTGANAEQQNDDGFSNIRRVVGGDTAVIARA